MKGLASVESSKGVAGMTLSEWAQSILTTNCVLPPCRDLMFFWLSSSCHGIENRLSNHVELWDTVESRDCWGLRGYTGLWVKDQSEVFPF